MSVERGVSSSSSKILTFFPRNMLTSFRISESFSEPKINEINARRLFTSNQKVIRLDVSMEKMIALNMFNSFKHLDNGHQNCFQTKFPLAIGKQLLEAWS